MKKVFKANGSAVTVEIFSDFVYVVGIAGKMRKINFLVSNFMEGVMKECQPKLIFCRATNQKAVRLLSEVNGWKFTKNPNIPDELHPNEPVFAIQPKALR